MPHYLNVNPVHTKIIKTTRNPGFIKKRTGSDLIVSYVKPAVRLQSASLTFRFTGLTNITSVQYKPVAGIGNQLCRDMTQQLSFSFEGSAGVCGQPKSG